MNRLKELREERGLTKTALSKATGIGGPQLSRYENKTNNPKMETWIKLANYFNVSVGYIMGISETESLHEEFQLPNTVSDYAKEKYEKVNNQKALINYLAEIEKDDLKKIRYEMGKRMLFGSAKEELEEDEEKLVNYLNRLKKDGFKNIHEAFEQRLHDSAKEELEEIDEELKEIEGELRNKKALKSLLLKFELNTNQINHVYSLIESFRHENSSSLDEN